MSNHSQHAAGGNLAVPSIDCASLFSWAAYHGLYLFPIPRGRKAPVGLVRSWSKEASNDPTQWCAWARQFPGCNFGVACKQSGLAVLDIDVKTAGRDAAWHAVHAWWWRLTGTDLPRDALVTTPSGGYHIYFRDPLGQVGNRAKIEGLVGILDIRGGANGDGGYVVSPYSHTDVAVGDGDVKATGWYVPSQSFPAIIPGLPAAAIAAMRPANLDTPKFDVLAERAVADAMSPGEREVEAGRQAQRADRLIAAAANAPEGQRNDSLFAASVEIGKGVELGLLNTDEYTPKLAEAAALSGLGDGRDVRNTIRSAGNYVKDGKAGDNTVRTAERIFGGGSATPSSPLAGDDAAVFADETAYPTTQDQELARMPVTESVIRAARRAGLDPHAALAATTTLASHALSQRFDTTVDGLSGSKPTPLTSFSLAVAPVGGGKSTVVDAVCGDIKSSLEAMRNARQRQVGKFLSAHKAASENHVSAPPLNVLKPDMWHSPNTTAQNFVDTVDDWQPVTTVVTAEGNQLFAANRGNNFDALSIAMVQAWDGRIEKQSRVRKDIARKQAANDRSDLEGTFGREVRFSVLLMQQTGNHEALLNDVLVSRAFESSGLMSRIGIFKCEEMTDTGVPITADLFADVQARIKLLYEVCKPKIKRTASYWIEKADAKPKPGRPDKGAVREVKAPKGMSVFTFGPGGSTTSSHAAAIGGVAHPVPPWLGETPRNDVPVDETPGQPLPSDDFPAPVDGIYLAGDTRAASLITLAPEAAAEINAAHKAFTMKYKNGGFGSVNDHLGGIVVRSRNRAIRLAATLYGLERGQDLAGDAIFNCAIIPAHIARFAWREIMYQFTNAMVNGLYGVHVYGHERKREAEERLKNAPTNTSLYEAFIKEVSDKFGNRPIVIRELVQAFNRRKFGGSIVDTKYARSALEWAVAARLFSAADETTSKGKTTRKYFAKPDLNALADQAEAEAAIDTQVRATAGSLQEAAAYPVRNGHLNPPPLATTPGAPPQLY